MSRIKLVVVAALVLCAAFPFSVSAEDPAAPAQPKIESPRDLKKEIAALETEIPLLERNQGLTNAFVLLAEQKLTLLTAEKKPDAKKVEECMVALQNLRQRANKIEMHMKMKKDLLAKLKAARSRT